MSMVNVRNLGFGGSGIPDAMPQAIAELQNQRMSIVAGAAANTLIVVPGMDPEDSVGSVVDLTTPATVDPATVTIQGRNASATVTCLTTALDGDTVVVNGKTYTFREAIAHTSYNAPPNTIPVHVGQSGVDAEAAAKALATAIMSGDSTLTATVGPNAASPPAMVVVTLKVRTPGTAGNAYTLVETGNAVTISGATFTGGTAAGSSGFKCSVSTAGKNLLVVWYDKHPGVATAPLMMEAEAGPPVGKLVFKSGKNDEGRGEDEGRGDDEGRGPDDGRNDQPDHPDRRPGPGRPTKPTPHR